MRKVQTVRFLKGIESMGSKLTISNKGADIVELEHGLQITSKTNQRVLVVPFNVIEAYELVPEAKPIVKRGVA